MRVFRYPLEVTDHQVLELPLSSEPLSVAPGRHFRDPGRRDTPRPMDEHVDLWVLVPEVAPAVPYHFWVVGTGNPAPPELAADVRGAARMFLGTAVMGSGLAWHVFWGT
jgi:hypothetical protein